ncbi:methionine adenosyltransferase [Thiospirochaeta perfilievii]|uniref:S-adenosylmethionine synthase n=1 Tax=Thiospirochaeta perfilievii TaxID=252967 RepID=A0A5C1QHM0_9SPIO|nr:methionine adenosyltransferase [Thiospirochaeta perfilievii]QEN06044.1 methionine adenosyltransferase [Thiospirochaeta perfilievii]
MANRDNYIFTSESVGEGHPDKVCDQISDAILDAALTSDPESRVGCECFASTGMILVGGEMTTNSYIDIIKTVKKTLEKIGYDNAEYGIDHQTCAVLSVINEQSADISQGVTAGAGLHKEQGAGDQGMMFGYACKDTPELMPAPIFYSHEIMKKASEVRHNRVLDFLRPDSKCQVTVEYKDGVPYRIPAVVLSHQHDEFVNGREIKYEEIREGLIEEIVKKALPSHLIDDKTIFHMNPTGRFVIGGPKGDAGLTGRKIIVDTYGGAAAHGGGAFSGKDPSKVDRSAAYMARYIAKNIVKAGIADKCEVELAYAIGVAEPVSVFVNTFNTGKIDDSLIEKAVWDNFSLTPSGIIKTLDLKRPIYSPTAAYGHFGRPDFPWEKTDVVEALKKALL